MVDPSALPGKIADVISCKSRIAAGEDAVDYEFNKF